MELKNNNGLHYIHQHDIEQLNVLKDKALRVRLSIIRYNKSKDENSLSACCRNCNDILKIIEEVFKCGDSL